MRRPGIVAWLWLCWSMLSPLSAAGQGEVLLAWETSAGAEGYRIHWGTSGPGTYSASIDVHDRTVHRLVGMEDCTTHWIAATAYNEAGSSVHSDYVATWPRPRVSGVTCLGGNTIRPGTSTTCAVTGDNLKGEATIRLTDSSGIQPAGVEITRVTVTSFCHSLSFSVTLDESSACPGGCTLELLVTQPSGVGSVPVSALTVQDRPPAPALVDVR